MVLFWHYIPPAGSKSRLQGTAHTACMHALHILVHGVVVCQLAAAQVDMDWNGPLALCPCEPELRVRRLACILVINTIGFFAVDSLGSIPVKHEA